jgi:hypothetical protein
MAQQPLVGQSLLIIEASRSHLDTPHSVGLLWTSDQPYTETSTWQHTTLTRDWPACPWGIRTRSLNKRAATDPGLRRRGHWDRQCIIIIISKCILANQILRVWNRLKSLSILSGRGFLWIVYWVSGGKFLFELSDWRLHKKKLLLEIRYFSTKPIALCQCRTSIIPLIVIQPNQTDRHKKHFLPRSFPWSLQKFEMEMCIETIFPKSVVLIFKTALFSIVIFFISSLSYGITTIIFFVA